MNKKALGLLAATSAIATATATAALAGTPHVPLIHPANHAPAISQAVSPTSARILDDVRAFGQSPSAEQAAAQQTLRDQLGASNAVDNGPIGAADFSRAVSAAISGSTARAWIVPSGDKVCVILPDPEDGYGASCSSAEDLEAGRAFVALGPGLHARAQTVTVAVVVPDTGIRPTLAAPDGTKTSLGVDGNVAAAVVPANGGDVLQLGDERVPLKSFARPQQ